MRFLGIAAALEDSIAGVQHRSVWPRLIARATRCDAAHLRWWVQNELRCLKIACDVLRLKVQHA